MARTTAPVSERSQTTAAGLHASVPARVASCGDADRAGADLETQAMSAGVSPMTTTSQAGDRFADHLRGATTRDLRKCGRS